MTFDARTLPVARLPPGTVGPTTPTILTTAADRGHPTVGPIGPTAGVVMIDGRVAHRSR
jgi:hypothetical protein